MDKIKQLMVKAGLSPEAANSICEAVDNHTNQLREQYESEFNARLEKAKQVCIEETEGHKKELSRRVQIFLEAKNESVRQQIAKQSAERGTQAEAKLEKVAALVEDIELDGQPNSELRVRNEKLSKGYSQLKGKYESVIKRSKTIQEMAEKVLKRNRVLEANLAKSGPTVTESKTAVRRSAVPQTTRRALTETVQRGTAKPSAARETSVSRDAQVADMLS